MSVLEKILTNFWPWLGVVILCGVVLDGIADIVKAFRR
jgi:hypothetical protein